jgi:hypothetical protein
MSGNDRRPIFSAIAAKASAEDIAARVAETVKLMPGTADIYLAEFARFILKKNLPFPHAEESAKLNLKETLEAAEGKRQISLHLRRFLTHPDMFELLDRQMPLYRNAKLKENASQVADAVQQGGISGDTPAKAQFGKRNKYPGH